MRRRPRWARRAALCLLAALLLPGCASLASLNMRAERMAQGIDLSDPRARAYFDRAVQVNEGQWNFDFAAWREDYTFTPMYRPIEDDNVPYALMLDKANEHDYKGCLRAAIQGLQANYVSLLLHNYAAYCLGKLGNDELAGYHRLLLHRLIYSIVDSGSGETPGQPRRFISARELRHFYTVLGYSVLASEIAEDTPEELGLDCERIQCSSLLLRLTLRDRASGKEFEQWADLSIAHSWLQRLEGPAASAPSSG